MLYTVYFPTLVSHGYMGRKDPGLDFRPESSEAELRCVNKEMIDKIKRLDSRES